MFGYLQTINSSLMIKNLFTVAWRNLKKYPGYSILNIFGLMIGITFSLFLIFYIRDELSFDNYHTKGDRIYRVNSYIKEPDKDMLKWAITQWPLAPTLQTKFPEVEEAVGLLVLFYLWQSLPSHQNYLESLDLFLLSHNRSLAFHELLTL